VKFWIPSNPFLGSVEALQIWHACIDHRRH